MDGDPKFTPYKNVPLKNVPEAVKQHWKDYQEGKLDLSESPSKNTRVRYIRGLFIKWGFLSPKRKRYNDPAKKKEEKRERRRKVEGTEKKLISKCVAELNGAVNK